MSERHAIGMVMLHNGERARRAREALGGCLPGASIGAVDDHGTFDVELDAESREKALCEVWNAVAECGCDDHIAFMEHPDLPEHWRHRADAPAQPQPR